jgi:hypothetical protein
MVSIISEVKTLSGWRATMTRSAFRWRSPMVEYAGPFKSLD